MAEEKKKESVEQIMMDICGIDFSKKKSEKRKKRNRDLREDIDIFAEDGKEL